MAIITQEYKHWLGELKQRIRQSQIKAAVKVNTELLQLYWQMGGEIVERQQNAQWGDGFLKQLSADLMAEFPEMKGFSYANLRYIKQWYLFYNKEITFCQQVVGKIDAVKTKQVVSQLGNEKWTQIVPELGKLFRKQSLFSPRRGNEPPALSIALGTYSTTHSPQRGNEPPALGNAPRTYGTPHSPQRGNEPPAQGIALGIRTTNNALKGQKQYRHVTITL